MQNDNIHTSFGDLAQLVEHTAHIRDVNGSIPLVANSKIQSFYTLDFFLLFLIKKSAGLKIINKPVNSLIFC